MGFQVLPIAFAGALTVLFLELPEPLVLLLKHLLFALLKLALAGLADMAAARF